MVLLRSSNLVNRNEGYMLDYGDDSWAMSGCLYGLVETAIAMFVYYVAIPVGSKLFGDRAQGRYRRVARRFPRSIVCPHCRYLVREP